MYAPREGNGTPLQYSCLEKSHGQRNLMGCSPWGREESDATERLHFHFSLSCTGEGNGNPLQYSCLENPRDGGAWWAAIDGVTQSRTRLKRLSSSSNVCTMDGSLLLTQFCWRHCFLLTQVHVIWEHSSLDSRETHLQFGTAAASNRTHCLWFCLTAHGLDNAFVQGLSLIASYHSLCYLLFSFSCYQFPKWNTF